MGQAKKLMQQENDKYQAALAIAVGGRGDFGMRMA